MADNIQGQRDCLAQVLAALKDRELLQGAVLANENGVLEARFTAHAIPCRALVRPLGVQFLARLAQVPPERGSQAISLVTTLNLHIYDGCLVLNEKDVWLRLSLMIPMRLISPQIVGFLLDHQLIVIENTADWLQKVVNDPPENIEQAVEQTWPLLLKGKAMAASGIIDSGADL
jgi:hypothetical protein